LVEDDRERIDDAIGKIGILELFGCGREGVELCEGEI
jgi:hypothetical protein